MFDDEDDIIAALVMACALGVVLYTLIYLAVR